MRESFSLFLSNHIDSQTKERRIKYYIRIAFNEYFGTPVWKMIINDTLYDLKRKLK